VQHLLAGQEEEDAGHDQQLRQEKGWSYSESFSEALVAFMANGIRDERTEEEIGRSYAEKIIATTEQMMKLALETVTA